MQAPETPVLPNETEAAKARKKRENLIRSISLNSVVIVFSIIAYFVYVAPAYEEINARVDEANATISKIETMRKNGISAEEFLSKTSAPGTKSGGAFAMNGKDKITLAMKQDANSTVPYFEWLNQAVGEASISALSASVEEKREVLGNIIPVFSETFPDPGLGFDKNRITLASFVKYVEERLFKRFKILSYSPLGLNQITFDNSKSSILNVGTFQMDLDFESSNSQIIELLDFIQNSGKISVENGKLVAPNPPDKRKKDPSLSDLNNLLITIDKFSIEKPLSDPDAKNHAKMSLVFYVKGRTYSSFVEIRSAIAEKIRALKDEMTKAADSCKNPNNPGCSSDAMVAAIGAIRSILPEIVALDAKAQGIVKTSNVSDLSSAFDQIFSMNSSVRMIEASFQKQKSILEKATSTKGTQKKTGK